MVGDPPKNAMGLMSHLEVDASERNDSAIGSEVSSETTSLASSALNYRYEHGRRYHAYEDGQYSLPNDEEEMDRLELQHRIWKIIFDKRLHLAPLPSTMTQALDIGCGTGAWTINFADAYPNTHVTGTDLSPIQPTAVPPNCAFIIEDASKEWTFPPDHFDYIHTRAVTMGIADWPRLMAQALKALKPGGWIELQEFYMPLGCDDSTMDGTAMARWGDEIHEALLKLGIDSLASLQHSRMLKEAGFGEIQQMELKAPLGTWVNGEKEKKVGWMGQKDLHMALEGMSNKLLATVGYTAEKIKDFVVEVKTELESNEIHAYMPLNVCWARKPLASAQ